MIPPALVLSAYLHRPFDYVNRVWQAGGLSAVTVVWCESQFTPTALRREPRNHTSWGLFQIDDEWHPQYRRDLAAHIREGSAFLAQCLEEGQSLGRSVGIYNSGSVGGNPRWSAYVVRWRDRLAQVLDRGG